MMNFVKRRCVGFGQESQRGMQGAKRALSIRSGRTRWRCVCTLFAHPSVCTLMLGSVHCSSQIISNGANIQKLGCWEPPATLLVPTSMLLWAFGFWSWQRTGQDWRCLNLPLKYQRLLLPLQLLKFGNTCKCHCLSGRSFAFPIPWSGGCLSSVSSPQCNVSGKSTDLIFGFCLNKISTRHMPELPVKGKPRHGLGNRTNVCRGVR